MHPGPNQSTPSCLAPVQCHAQCDWILLGHGSGRLSADRLLGVMRSHPIGKQAALIGEVVADSEGLVTRCWVVGGEVMVTMLAGE